MENEGLVVTSSGRRQSSRRTKGKAPVRYVDENFAKFMLEDVDIEALEDSTSSSDSTAE